MLYATTRSNLDAFTPNHPLRKDRGGDGGLYVPFREPQLSELVASGKRGNACMAQVLNTLFGTRLTGTDLDFALGRNPVRLRPLGYRTFSGECWHNPQWDHDWMVGKVAELLAGEALVPTDWVKIAVRIGILAQISGELHQAGIRQWDVCMLSGDYSGPISAWYARSWGLPIGNIVSCCNENNALWELLCQGQLRTDGITVPTDLPEGDVASLRDLERLICACGGTSEVRSYLTACREGTPYRISDALRSRLSRGQYVSVVSSQRLERIIPDAYRTHGCILSYPAALAYAGLLDYRAKTGQTRYAVVLSELSPRKDARRVAKALGLRPGELERELEK